VPFLSTTEMNALTERNLRRSIIDQRFQSATMLGIFRGKKRLKLEEGGSIIAQPILAQINETAQSYSGADVLNATAQEEFTDYEIQWKQATVSVVVTGLDRERNNGRYQAINFVKNKQESALLALFNLMANFVFGDGTGNNGKDWDGFLGAINNTAGFANYLGVDDVIGNLGFSNIAFQGKAVVEDSHNPANTMYYWNLEHARMFVHRNKNFVWRPFQEPDNQDIQIGRWIVYGNMELRKPASCGVYRNILNG
jgi:hypothetical protein